VVRSLNASVHKNLNLPEVYIINCIDINMIDAMTWNGCQSKGEPGL
jgi:hypothetical protein